MSGGMKVNFKIRLKRVNRGLVLGAAVILGTALYVFIAHRRFVNATDGIKTDASNFINAYMTATESDIKGVWSEEDKKAQIAEIDKVMDAYWTDKTIGSSVVDGMLVGDGGGMCKKKDFKDFYKMCYDEDYVGNVKDCDASIEKAKIKEYGNKGALYTADVTVTMTIPKYMCFPGLSGYDTYYDDIVDFVGEDSINTNEDRQAMVREGYIKDDSVEVSVKYSVSFIYLYTDGEWKISEAEIYSMWDGEVIGETQGEKYEISNISLKDDEESDDVQTPMDAIKKGEE